MLGFDDVGYSRRFLGTHVEDAVDRQERVVDFLAGQAIHERHVAGVAGNIDADAIDVDEIANAFKGVMLVVSRRGWMDMEAMVIEVVVDAVFEGVGRANDDGPRRHGDKVYRVVVVMLVGDENQIGFGHIAFAGEGINVNDFAFARGNAQRSVPLIKKFCHSASMVWFGSHF